ncbi:MAG TPA: hypothetical protein PK092_08145 [Chitinophagaceae bacterium]|nr:hypothetical protein [Chitinophagaceae bacterium]
MKKITGTLIITFMFSTVLVAQDAAEVEQLLDNERYESAEAILEKKLNTDGVMPDISYLLVKTYLEQDKVEEVKDFISKYKLSDSPESDPLDRITYARYLLQKGDKAGADAIFNSILENKKNRKNPSLLMAMAEVNISEPKGDASLALEWLKMAADKDDDNPSIFILEGLAYRKLSDASKAYLAYQQALKKDKNNVKAHYMLGKIFTAQKNSEVYLEHFMKAYEVDSTYAPVLEALYDHYYNVDVRIARKFLEKFIANTDHNIQHDYRMTDIYYLTGDYDRAITEALKLIDTEKEKAQPRLYKLMAYSALKSKDSLKALEYVNQYFSKEQPAKFIAADFELKAILTEAQPGAEKGAIEYYSIAAEMDTLVANKLKFATAIIKLAKKADMASIQAYWLGKLYQWKDKTNNIDLFNWGLAHYTAAEYLKSDSVFTLYTERYPEDIFGYYWRAQSNAAIDTSLIEGLAVPHYIRVTEIGEKDKEKNKKMLLKAYGYLGGYEANARKDYVQSLMWFEKYLELDSENADAKRYAETLRKWIEEQKK